jgi:DivIVA domain-containing protein
MFLFQHNIIITYIFVFSCYNMYKDGDNMKEQSLTIEEILKKDFKKKKIGGIDQVDVDEFLNSVIDDYEYFIEKINILKDINEKLRDENYKLKMVEIKSVGEKDTFQEKIEIVKEDTPVVPQEEEIKKDPNLERVEALEREIARIKESLIK